MTEPDVERLLEGAWGIIANAYDGAWPAPVSGTRLGIVWTRAANKWRDQYFAWQERDAPPVPQTPECEHEKCRKALCVDCCQCGAPIPYEAAPAKDPEPPDERTRDEIRADARAALRELGAKIPEPTPAKRQDAVAELKRMAEEGICEPESALAVVALIKHERSQGDKAASLLREWQRDMRPIRSDGCKCLVCRALHILEGRGEEGS